MAEHDRDRIKAQVPCSSLLKRQGWKVDLRESTPKAIKYRRGKGEIVIVIHEGRGWFDPLSEDKGDVFSLARHLGAPDFGSSLKAVAELVGFEPCAPVWQRKSRRQPSAGIQDRWLKRPVPTPASPAWAYLAQVRAVPEAIVAIAARAGRLREGPKGSVWAAHVDLFGQIVGWEERGPNWRGFSTGGGKSLFCFGKKDARRLCVTEAAIDAMSLAATEGCRTDTIYASTGGGWAPTTERHIRALVSRPGAELVAAGDANDQGDAYATRLRAIALAEGVAFLRLWPNAIDWNEQLSEARGDSCPAPLC
ncbi:MAG TPA: DUF3991 domain-containing protein [Nitrobacter sp.]|nr:DUF3991 domain-containing protein [Nitrobacter sp.]